MCPFLAVFRAAPGERNDLDVTRLADGRFAFVDRGSAINPGPGCGTESGRVVCDPRGFPGNSAGAVDPPDIGVGDLDDRVLEATGFGATITGGAGDDIVAGGSAANLIVGNGGNDRLAGSGGNDIVRGGSGADRLRGNAGRDGLAGGSGADRLVGGDGRDRLFGNGGPDRLNGNNGRDRYRAGPGNDRVRSVDGIRERVNCGTGFDRAVVDRRPRDATAFCNRVRRVTFRR